MKLSQTFWYGLLTIILLYLLAVSVILWIGYGVIKKLEHIDITAEIEKQLDGKKFQDEPIIIPKKYNNFNLDLSAFPYNNKNEILIINE